MQTSEELKVDGDCLVVFIDETGYETFAGKQPYYAVGGCAVIRADYEWVRAQWRELRRAINGDPDLPLHAAEFPHTPENFATMRQFFASPAFARFAVAATSKTNFAVDMHAMAAVMGMLKEYIARVVPLVPCSTVALIFEASQRGDPLVRRHFGEFELQKNQRSVPIDHYFMPKSGKEPGLEVADFVASAAGSQARFYHRGKTDFAQDYQDVFRQFPPPFSQFFHIKEVGGSHESHEAWVQGFRRTGVISASSFRSRGILTTRARLNQSSALHPSSEGGPHGPRWQWIPQRQRQRPRR
jgi:hypothetical protein